MQNIKNIKKLIEKRKYSTSKTSVAKQLGISLGQLTNILAGRRKANPDVIKKIEKQFNIKLSNN